MTIPSIIAAIDLGSNSFRLKIVERTATRMDIVKEKRIRVQLASGLDKQNYLSQAAILRAKDALADFQRLIEHYQVTTVRAVATNTFRVASNVEELLTTIAEAFHYPIEIISGEQEAKLIYQGVTSALNAIDSAIAVIDIGGGSTEVVTGYGKHINVAVSLPMGCISFQKQFFGDNLIKKHYFEKAFQTASTLIQAQTCWQPDQFAYCYGSSGTIGALWSVLNYSGFHANHVTLDVIIAIIDEVTRLGCYDQLQRLGVASDRKAIFPSGLAILHALFVNLQIQRLTITSASLRDGLLA